jgi:hypothetical protein
MPPVYSYVDRSGIKKIPYPGSDTGDDCEKLNRKGKYRLFRETRDTKKREFRC